MVNYKRSFPRKEQPIGGKGSKRRSLKLIGQPKRGCHFTAASFIYFAKLVVLGLNKHGYIVNIMY